MPSRDPRHSTHNASSRSRALHQSRTVGVWWFVRLRRAELLRGCCAKRPSLDAVEASCGTTFISPRRAWWPHRPVGCQSFTRRLGWRPRRTPRGQGRLVRPLSRSRVRKAATGRWTWASSAVVWRQRLELSWRSSEQLQGALVEAVTAVKVGHVYLARY
jgi:hypothetical protein